MDTRTLILGTLLASAVAGPALAGPGGFPEPGNLTGFWSGEMKCKLFDGTAVVEQTLTGQLYVVQNGIQLAVKTDLSDGSVETVTTQGVETPPATMCGVLFAKKETQPDDGVGTISPLGAQGEISLGVLEESQVAALKTRTFAQNDKGETGKLSGRGTLLPSHVIGSCRWKFARTSTLVPMLMTSFCLGEV